MSRKHIIERAFELARSGEYPTITEIRKRLGKEDYPSAEQHLQGAGIRRDLRAVIRGIGR